MSSRGLLGLAPELLIRIIDLADPSSHLDLACTCRQLLSCSQGVFRQHREAHQRLSVISDLDPSTIPTLLRSASGITSPIDAWHVRHIEIWGSRWSWKEWRPWKLRPKRREPPVPRDERRHAFESSQPLEWSVPRWEMAHYLKIMKDTLGLTDQLIDLAFVEIDKGSDSAMQMLLIVLCPRLKSLKYIYNKHDTVRHRRSLFWLTFALGKGWIDGSWSPGLRSLREVAVGVHSDTWLDQDSIQLWYTRSCFRGFMKLPNISSLYFRGTRPGDSPVSHNINYQTINHDAPGPITEFLETAELRHAADALPAGCSPVEHLFLEMVCDIHSGQEKLAAAPQALKTYTLLGAHDASQSQTGFLPLVERMVPKQVRSLESIVVYNAWGFRQQNCTLYHLEGDINLRRCSQLRQVHIQIDDLVMNTSYSFPWGIQMAEEAWEHDGHRLACIDYIIGLFPRSLQVLLVGSANNLYLPTDHLTESILIGMVESEKLPDLKAIYFDPTQVHHDDLFAELVEVGWQNEVDIHIKGNPHLPRYESQFPMPPHAITQPPHIPNRLPDFDPFHGRWLDPTN
ncbi:hypothetical protein FGRMN_2937 [Fusarium graminum]|nr:hypothetical protein FGRMN_2937 [Fusarium graminum]